MIRKNKLKMANITDFFNKKNKKFSLKRNPKDKKLIS
jgi:hypothetical protein